MIWAAKPQGIWHSGRKSERWIFGRFERPLLHRILFRPYFMLLNPNHVEGFEACHAFSSSYTDSRAVNFCMREDERVQSLEMVLQTMNMRRSGMFNCAFTSLWQGLAFACFLSTGVHTRFTATFRVSTDKGRGEAANMSNDRTSTWYLVNLVIWTFSSVPIFFCSGPRNRVAWRDGRSSDLFRGSGRHQ